MNSLDKYDHGALFFAVSFSNNPKAVKLLLKRVLPSISSTKLTRAFYPAPHIIDQAIESLNKPCGAMIRMKRYLQLKPHAPGAAKIKDTIYQWEAAAEDEDD